MESFHIDTLIRTKRAVRQYRDLEVSEETIREILDAGRRAQSSHNDQPWQFVVTRDRDTLIQLSQCGRYAGHLADAAFAVALVSPDPTGFDLGQAAAYLQLAAWDRGIGSCPTSMWEAKRAGAILGIPADLYFDIMIAFGYPAPIPTRPAGGPVGRRPMADIVHWEQWRP